MWPKCRRVQQSRHCSGTSCTFSLSACVASVQIRDFQPQSFCRSSLCASPDHGGGVTKSYLQQRHQQVPHIAAGVVLDVGLQVTFVHCRATRGTKTITVVSPLTEWRTSVTGTAKSPQKTNTQRFMMRRTCFISCARDRHWLGLSCS